MVILRYLGGAVGAIFVIHVLDSVLMPLLYPLIALAALIAIFLFAVGGSSFLGRKK